MNDEIYNDHFADSISRSVHRQSDSAPVIQYSNLHKKEQYNELEDTSVTLSWKSEGDLAHWLETKIGFSSEAAEVLAKLFIERAPGTKS